MHRRFFPLLALASLSAFGAGALGCSAPPKKKNKTTLEVRDDEQPDKKPGRRDGDRKPEEDPVLPDGTKPPGRVYAHTADTLYLFDPLAKELTEIGELSCLEPGDRLLDIALDRDSVMYGTSDDGFLKIDPVDATCTYVKVDPFADYPNSLAFVPIGTVDTTREALVGYGFDPVTRQATVYVRIFLDGAVETIGDLNHPNAEVKYKSSGDLVALIRNGNKAYLTVKEIGGDTDFLAEIDPATGRIKKILGDTGKEDFYGLGQWAGKGYGFNAAGEIAEIDLTNGAAKTLLTLTDDDGFPQAWFGAGMTTDAPTKP